ncbi:hypothetical protein CDEST_00097 [Colletotrichum destructivum]|uniref:Secreted protein n=1 Tax=Colletotrichum destructivum TaxID=34406 RepID=A0AAX4HWE0_9PEZI|nr:hypothetical protein CDEST_00097 [Colletotrichum destructivum]
MVPMFLFWGVIGLWQVSVTLFWRSGDDVFFSSLEKKHASSQGTLSLELIGRRIFCRHNRSDYPPSKGLLSTEGLLGRAPYHVSSCARRPVDAWRRLSQPRNGLRSSQPGLLQRKPYETS